MHDIRPGRRATPTSARFRTVALVLTAAALALTGCAGQAPSAAPISVGAPGTATPDAPSGTAAHAAAPAAVTSGPVNAVTLGSRDGATVGVGQPVSLLFSRPVQDKAAVERALRVTTSNDTVGAWGWVRTPAGQDRLDWRPKDYWRPGTVVRLTADLTHVDPGGSHFTENPARSFTIGHDQRLVADLDTHRLTVTRDGQVVKTVPISGGEPVAGRASRPGVFAIKSREDSVHMTSASVNGPKFYDKTVHWAMRFTDSGGYLHAAPWATADIGVRNSGGGCVGMNDADATWLYDNSQLGDLLTIQGKDATTPYGGPGNGYGDWNLNWSQWQATSALHG